MLSWIDIVWRGCYYLVVGKIGQGRGKTMATSFKTIDDVVEQYVHPTLGDYADDYDVRGIAEAISYYDDGYCDGVRHADKAGFRISESIESNISPQVYWDIVASYARGN